MRQHCRFESQSNSDRHISSGWCSPHNQGRFGYPEAVEPLIAIVRRGESDDSLGSAAAMALLRLGRPAVLPVIGLLQDDDPWVRRVAADILGSLRDCRAIDPLTAMAQDPDPSVRSSVAEALEEMSGPGDECRAPPV